MWMEGGRRIRRERLVSDRPTQVLCGDARSLGPTWDTKNLERPANTLVYSVSRDPEFLRDLLRREMLVHQAQAVELARAELGHSISQM
jgi:hypothetical protein